MKTIVSMVLAVTLGLVATAGAVPIPTCAPGDFQLIAKDKVGFENGPVDIKGNVLVTASDGEVFVGAHNKIGRVVGHEIFLGTGAVVQECIVDKVTGPGTCVTKTGTFAASPAGCHVFPFTAQPVDPCVNTAPGVSVQTDATVDLAPGCYGILRVGADATLNLQAGVYFARELRTLNGATIQGVPGTKLRVKNGGTVSATSRLLDLEMFSAGTVGQFQIGNAVTLTDTVVVALFSSIHVHTGASLDGSTLAAASIVVEPITSKDEQLCACPVGFHLPGLNICVPD